MRCLFLISIALMDVGGFSFTREPLPSKSQFVFTSQELPEKATEKRPVVRVYWATWCRPCGSAKTDWDAYGKTHAIPFDIVLVDVSKGGQPDWCSEIPAMAWEAKGQTRYILGYPGAEKLIQRWKLTQPK